MGEGGPAYELRRHQERAHILWAVLKAIDNFGAVAAVVQSCDSGEFARAALMDLLEIDEVQARAVMDMQVLQLSRRQRIASEYESETARVAELRSKLAGRESSGSADG
jgi:DNA gyrase subunit A